MSKANRSSFLLRLPQVLDTILPGFLSGAIV